MMNLERAEPQQVLSSGCDGRDAPRNTPRFEDRFWPCCVMTSYGVGRVTPVAPVQERLNHFVEGKLGQLRKGGRRRDQID